MTAMTEPRTDGIVIEDNNYDAHYKSGYYYTWDAATADSGASLGNDATDSICPSGWQLPTSRGTGSYTGLIDIYGIGNNAAGATAMISAPLYFVHSGNIMGGSFLFSANSSGQYWTSTRYRTSYASAYNMDFDFESVDSFTDDYVWRGFSVRCIASF